MLTYMMTDNVNCESMVLVTKRALVAAKQCPFETSKTSKSKQAFLLTKNTKQHPCIVTRKKTKSGTIPHKHTEKQSMPHRKIYTHKE